MINSFVYKNNKRQIASADKEICEIKPIKFGGSPTDPANKMILDRRDHIKYVNYWNQLLRKLKNKKA